MSRFFALIALVIFLFSSSSSVRAQTLPAAALANDITILNFALTLENADSTFFSTFLAAFNTTGFTQANFVAAGFNASVYTELVLLAQEEIAHAQVLAATVTALGGTPVPKCVYNFSGVTSVLSYLQTGLIFETTGTGAYDGGINAITNPTIQQAAATIATVEARHASYLLTTLGQLPSFASAFDNAFTPQQVYNLISPFIVSCPYNVTASFPTVRPYGVALASGTNGTNSLVTNYTGLLAAGNNSYTQADLTNDLNTLNYALVLEQLESAFYNYSSSLYNASSFAAAGYNSSVYSTFVQITSNEAIHVSALRAVISGTGGTPYPVCNYAPLFALVTSVQSYVAVAQVLENTGVSAYDGAVNAIASTQLQQVAATIATIEARHAAFLNLLVTGQPFPNVTDTPMTPTMVAAAVSSLQICSFVPTLPVVARLQVPLANVIVPSVRGDPSFVGFHGQSFQVHGIPNRYFNLLSTASLQFNALFRMLVDGESLTATQMKAARVSRQLAATKSTKASKLYSLPLTTAYSHEGTFLAEMGLKLNDVQVFAQAGAYATGFSKVTVAGVAVSVSSTATEIATGMYVTLSTPSVLTIDTPQVSFTLVNADNFFNIEQATLNQAHTDDSVMDGLLGQTANPAWKVLNDKEFKQHMVYDYLLAEMDAFSDDFVSNVYTAAKAQ